MNRPFPPLRGKERMGGSTFHPAFKMGPLAMAFLFSAACVTMPPTRPRISSSPETPPSSLFICPLENPRVLSPFGQRGRRFHEGIDLRTGRKAGQPIFAARSGRVIFAAHKRRYGKMALIEHDDGYKTRYAHMNRMHVRQGQLISQGDLVGTVGQTGNASGPHLHFEIITPKNYPVNPAPYIFHRKEP
jgi:murein DD-endopeptidase MepM/ murein hydrolase activator NlpD